jgi:SP family general alpha glucoside:H+ symporter-like MFS transporter
MSISRSHGETLEVHVDDEQFRKMSIVNPNIVTVAEDAARAAEAEQTQTFWQSLKLYKKAAGWSVLLSCAIIMEGFDIVLIANLVSVYQCLREI